MMAMKDKKKMYEIPESEDIKVHIEECFLQASGDVPPIHGGDDPNDLPSGDVES